MNDCYSCLIVDDESLGRDLIETHLQRFPKFSIAAKCSSAIEASQVLSEQSVDLMFLDIEMPVLKGTEFYSSLSRNRPSVIFTTAHRDYALDGFELDAVDYLLKPITFTRFFKSIERFLAQQDVVASGREKLEGHLFVRCDRKDVRVSFSDILFVKGLKDYIEIVTPIRKYLVKSTLSSFLDRLPVSFIQIHRSYIVNSDHITAFTKHDVEVGEEEIPIGKAFQGDLKRIL
ncbi:response regulator transcription factor [uncultured Pseudoteredinibacter sp.]|uniref:LytR/AlgR family response regulator transcription factor n=1 Tax=uncultured Pseudoteredinibacter sp. TaxID=1641701 RepID=UPI00262A1D25|nr:response regulator transcription factor [uncultured Pseudoteredinibacter sp.]